MGLQYQKVATLTYGNQQLHNIIPTENGKSLLFHLREQYLRSETTTKEDTKETRQQMYV